MKNYVVKPIDTPILNRITCDCCGKDIDIVKHEEYISIKKEWGYNAMIFSDNEKTELDLCEKCFSKILTTIHKQDRI